VLTTPFGDLNQDGTVDVGDLVSLASHLNGTRLLAPPIAARADLDQNGIVNSADRQILAELIASRHTQARDDFDNDESSNLEEIQRGTNPFDPDTDHDGSLDGWEVAEGTHPLDPGSRVPLLVLAQPPVRILHPLIQCGSGSPQPAEFLLRHPQILEQFVKQPAADFCAGVDGNGGGATVGMNPPRVAAPLAPPANPSFSAARMNSLALGGMVGEQLDIFRHGLSALVVFLHDHVEHALQFRLRLLWSPAEGMATFQGGNVGHETAVVVPAADHLVIEQRFHTLTTPQD